MVGGYVELDIMTPWRILFSFQFEADLEFLFIKVIMSIRPPQHLLNTLCINHIAHGAIKAYRVERVAGDQS